MLLVVLLMLSGFNEGCAGKQEPTTSGEGLRSFALPIPLFAENAAWRQSAAGAAVEGKSLEQMLTLYRVLLGCSSSLNPPTLAPSTPWPYPFVNLDEFTVAVFEAGDAQAAVQMRDYEGNSRSLNGKFTPSGENAVIVNQPAGAVRAAGPQDTSADGHLVLFHVGSRTEFDFWQATTSTTPGGGQTGNSVSAAGAVDRFEVQGGGVNAVGLSSARAMGTPLLAGLLVPEDIRSGIISHALAFAIPGPRNTASDPYSPTPSDFLYPASTTEADFYSTNANALAAGQRIRLASTLYDADDVLIDESTLAPVTRLFLAALRTYGAYLVDNAGGFGFYAEDIHSANLDLTDDQVSSLLGAAAGTAIPAGQTKWQVIIEKLNADLERIPVGAGDIAQTACTATFANNHVNFEVVTPATGP
jgi:hypothetical protein